MNDVPKPVLNFLSIMETENLYAEVPDEMLIHLQTPEIEQNFQTNQENNNYINHLSTTQQDDLMRKYILQEKAYTPEAKCSDCATSSCKSCRILKNQKSYAAYQAYQKMYKDMKLVQINGKQKV